MGLVSIVTQHRSQTEIWTTNQTDETNDSLTMTETSQPDYWDALIAQFMVVSFNTNGRWNNLDRV